MEQRVLNIIKVIGQQGEPRLGLPLAACGIRGAVDRVSLAIELEERFNIWIPDEAAEAWHTTDDVVKTVRECLASQDTPGNGG